MRGKTLNSYESIMQARQTRPAQRMQAYSNTALFVQKYWKLPGSAGCCLGPGRNGRTLRNNLFSSRDLIFLPIALSRDRASFFFSGGRNEPVFSTGPCIIPLFITAIPLISGFESHARYLNQVRGCNYGVSRGAGASRWRKNGLKKKKKKKVKVRYIKGDCPQTGINIK